VESQTAKRPLFEKACVGGNGTTGDNALRSFAQWFVVEGGMLADAIWCENFAPFQKAGIGRNQQDHRGEKAHALVIRCVGAVSTLNLSSNHIKMFIYHGQNL
jgi:hypothetical protein